MGLSPHGSWGASRPTVSRNQPKFGQSGRHDGPAHVFSEDVSWVLGAEDVHQLELLAPDLVLYPQVRDGKVANLADALALANADRGSGISVDSNLDEPAEITQQRLESESLSCTIGDSMEFRLAATERYGGLSLAPMLQ